MKKTLYLVLVLIIFGLSYLKWLAWKAPDQPQNTQVSSPEPSSLPKTGSTLKTPYFSIDYPSVASSSPVSELPDSTTWSVSYMGPKQKASGRTQTELFDGYAVSLTRFSEIVGDDPLTTQAESDRQGTIDGCGEDSVTQITSLKLVNHQALSFTGGCLGEATNYYLLAGSALYRISTMAVGTPEDSYNYEQTVKDILSSLEFTEN